MEPRTLLPVLVVVTTLLVSTWQQQQTAAAAECQRRCGGVDIPYPFGIGRGCYLETSAGDMSAFSLTCKNLTADGLRRAPFIGALELLDVSLRRGQVRVRNRISSWCGHNGSTSSRPMAGGSQLLPSSFRVSDAANRFTVIGCDALAYVGAGDGDDDEYIVGCRSMCPSAARLANGSSSCSGMGCCQAAVPPGLSRYQVWFDDIGSSVSRPCSYAVLAEAASFEFRTTYLTTGEFLEATGGQVPLVLDWVAGNQTCLEATTTTHQAAGHAYACVSGNSECVDSRNGPPGYLCNCSAGYQGNPYAMDGCQDINECEQTGAAYPCSAPDTCSNTAGGFRCLCPAGHSGNAYTGPCERKRSERPWQAAIGVSVGVVVLAVGMSCAYAAQEKRRLAAVKARHFRQHGGLLLFEEMMKKKGNGVLSSSFTLFTRQELRDATGGFDERHVLGRGGNGTVYRGTLRDGTVVAIKRCRVAADGMDDGRRQREFGRETLILSQINHKNIVKLYGCCLEVEVPMLVYQFIPNGTLYQLLHGGNGGAAVLPFAARLRIAHETAEALAYLHSMASPPIIHGDVKSPNILLDGGYAAKVSDFGAATLAPPTDELAHLVTFVQGTCGYLDPEYMQTCRLTEKSDVYSFGVVLLELLTSRKALNLAAPDDERSLAASFLSAARDRRLDRLLDARVKGEVEAEVLELVAKLAKSCLEMSGERRPSMREVAEELDRIRKMSSLSQGPCLAEAQAHSVMDVTSDR